MDEAKTTEKSPESVRKDVTDKTKKLTDALYRVTDLLSDREPIKWALRNKALSLYDNLMSFSFIKDKNAAIGDTIDSLYQTISILDLCSTGSSISNLNFEILKREYNVLKSFIENNKDSIILEKYLLTEIGAPMTGASLLPPVSGENSSVKVSSQPSVVSSIVKEKIVQSFDGPGRKQAILRFLKKEGSKTIGEITPIFKGKIGPKTVQRDLLALVKANKLKAKGEKRWRVYAIV